MPFPLFSVLAAAGSAIVNGVATSRANKINQRNYDEVRRYNTPAAQMARFRSANLNPNLIYTQTNEAEQRPEWKPPQYDFSALANAPSELSSYQNIKESQARVDNLKKQNQLLDSQLIGQNIENYWKGRINSKQVSEIAKRIDLIDKQLANIDWEQEFKGKELTQRGYELFWSNVFRYGDLQQRNKELQQRIKEFSVSSQWQLEVNKLLNWLTQNGDLTLVEAVPLAAKEIAVTLWDRLKDSASAAWNNVFGTESAPNYHWNINNFNK